MTLDYTRPKNRIFDLRIKTEDFHSVHCTLAKSEGNPGRPLPISLWWLECVDDELSALAVGTCGDISLSLSPHSMSSVFVTWSMQVMCL
jgi:hypothetical protein